MLYTRTRRAAVFAVSFVVVLVLFAGIALAVLPPGGTFVDDDGNVHEANIEAIANAGITLGCNPPTNDRYCPDSAVTRGQMAAFLVRALHLTATGDKDFIDDNDSVFETDIEKLAEAGITLGCNPPDNTRFCPDSAVTRGQMAAFLVRALHLTATGDKDFIDDNDSVFEADIEMLAEEGITYGCNPPDYTMFCPDDDVTRDQMASFLTRALGLTPIPPPERHPGDTKNCTDFATWTEAQAWFDLYYPTEGDVANLDQDGDLIACESLPGAPG
jgi:hypothetical protein